MRRRSLRQKTKPNLGICGAERANPNPALSANVWHFKYEKRAGMSPTAEAYARAYGAQASCLQTKH
ncbi:MAG: hypothetical protein D6808_08010 [Candidatus Dadabacteria bacterium]|nr:MAG: hypothetical protein D6808_08010 [Candidatus Dadabacteria bacterium]